MSNMPVGLGCGIPWQNHEVNAAVLDNALATLSPSWFYDWKHGQMHRPGYHGMLWACDRTTYEQRVAFNAAVAAAKSKPERLFFLGNEPERVDQSQTTVWAFGAAAKEFRRRVPNVPLALPGIMINDAGLYWMAGYHVLVGMGKALVPDFWHVHNYAWTTEQWENNLERFQRWTRDAGMVRPIIVSETAGAMGGYPTMTSDATNLLLMERVKAALRAGDIQAAAWMSSMWHAWPGPASDLLRADGRVTSLGREFVEMA
jgi:hypothetical protein